MSHQVVVSQEAPQPVGPYSQAIVARGVVYTAGQIPLDIETGQIIDGDASDQALLVLKHLQYVLAAAGCQFKDVVKVNIYLKSMADFAAVNAIYATFFTGVVPARSTVEVSRLPKDALVEMDLIAVQPSDT